MSSTAIKRLVKEKTGLMFDGQFSEKFNNAVHELMSERNIRSEGAYLALLKHNENEFARLMTLLTINETYFFRESLHLNVFSERLIPALLAGNRQKRKLKILSAGCSTGEEPYSLVMLLMEKYGDTTGHLFSFSGFDIDSEAIQKAKQGVFELQSFRSSDLDLQKFQAAYFDKIEKNRFKIKDVIREKVDFEIFNFLSEAYTSTFSGMDIIFYRNVSIYFDSETRKRILEKLSSIMNDYGFLILSSTETLPNDMNIFSLIEIDGVFLFVKDTAADPFGNREPYFETLKKRNPGISQSITAKKFDKNRLRADDVSYDRLHNPLSALRHDKSLDELLDQALSLAENKRYTEALSLVDAVMAMDPGFIRAYKLKAGILVNLDQRKAAETICLKIIEEDPLYLESYLLLGIIARKNNDEDTAIKRFREALYVKSSCWLAHFYLAELFTSQGAKEQARQEYQIVMNILEKDGILNSGISFFPIKATTKQMINLCRHSLAGL